MKFKKTITTILSLAILSGCTSGATGSENATEKESSITSEEVENSSTIASSSQESEKKEPVVYEYQINPDIFTVQPIHDANSKVALLTFDDSPQPPDSYTIQIAETVQSKNANAIFFVMGQFLEEQNAKDIIRTVYDMGFEIGNHSYSHPSFHDLSYEEQLEEITSTNQLVEEITGEKPRFLRAPYGQYNEDTKNILDQEGMTMMNWTYGYDWVEEYMNATALADIMVDSEFLGDGANLLMHDRKWTAEAIGDIMDGLREKGYEFVDPTVIASPEREVE
ncbi:polysaccharide deacetylase family protein [Jeotgalibaca sp. MA1X17-3]|uniref:polysaccharide deacetylase family protein n=1 Tax=Jeotgalibaca sp. MA1X17-3 TaxID=2908211 RepID=UPI001F389F4B|nr:polysaccharide deacetylase family protein [Jeotgalibaca sp. MA1X17-3]UJF14753.1 polysaccharide deacetylase family protein [Jeotgalibaca sp. MA1X17-3]